MDSSLVIFTLITHRANLTNQNPNLRPAPLNKRILFRIVTTIPQQSRRISPQPPPSASPAVPHVPQPRTHGALQRPICPTCPSNPDTWRTSTAYMTHMSLSHGHMAQYIMTLALIKIFQGYSQPRCTLIQGFLRFEEYPH